MVDIVELRKTASLLRQWAEEILLDCDPAPYPTADTDVGVPKQAAKLMEEAADQIERQQSN